MKSLETRIAMLEAQAAPIDNVPDVIFVVGLRPGALGHPSNYASTGHVRLSHEDEIAFMKRIETDLGPRNGAPALVFLSDDPPRSPALDADTFIRREGGSHARS